MGSELLVALMLLQVYVSYGEKTSGQLLLSYGFLPAAGSNRHDACLLELTVGAKSRAVQFVQFYLAPTSMAHEVEGHHSTCMPLIIGTWILWFVGIVHPGFFVGPTCGGLAAAWSGGGTLSSLVAD